MFHSVREIKPTRRSVFGLYPFRRQYSLAYESSLERDFIVLQEFDSSVIEVIAQPIKIPCVVWARLPKAGNVGRSQTGIRMAQPLAFLVAEWKAAYCWAVEWDFLFHIYDESRIKITLL